MGNTINTISYSLFIFERNTISLKKKPCSFSIYFEILRVYSHRGKILSLRIVGYAHIYIYKYIDILRCGKVVKKLAKGKKRGVPSYDQRGSSFFKLDVFLPNLVQLSPRNPSRIFSKICHGPVFANPLPSG